MWGWGGWLGVDATFTKVAGMDPQNVEGSVRCDKSKWALQNLYSHRAIVPS